MRLLIFTQKIDRDDVVLGFFHEWVLEFAKTCESVSVICLYKGEYDLPKNVEVYSLGKEKSLGRVSYIINLYRHLSKLNDSYDRVFVHMNPIYVVLVGWYFNFKKIPVYLWYVHRNVDLKLRFALSFVKKVFSSAPESFRIKTSKVVFLGHGIETNRFPNSNHQYEGGELRIAHVGRVTPIKNLEVLIESVALLKEKGLVLKLQLFGECATPSDQKYKESLTHLVAKKRLQHEVYFAGAIKPQYLPQSLAESHISVNLTPPGGMDKAVLEAILLGLPTFVSNTAFKSVFGKYEELFIFQFKNPQDLANKISSFVSLTSSQEIVRELEEKVRREFSLDYLVARIINLMK